jgi:hypothetical protein
MTQLEINGINFPVDPAMQTWRELIEDLENNRIGKGKAISSVHIDGTEVQGFREESALTRPLNTIDEIKIELVDMSQLVADAVKDCDSFLLSLQTAMVDAADTFRQQQLDQANQKLTEIYQSIKMLVSLLKGLEISFQNQGGSVLQPSVDQLVNEMGPTLEGLIDAQSSQDWILVADILEFELAAAVSNYEQVVQSFKKTLGIV